MNRVKRIPLLGCAALLLASPTAAHACSKQGFPSRQVPRGAHLIATAGADTVAAGPGDVRYVVSMGHFGPAGERPVYGQVVQVERIGGLAARGLDPSVKRVVLVPWDYGADCRTTPWTRSARWVAPGTRGLFTATLRDRAHWASGLPTFDVHSPESNPYPQTARVDDDEAADSLLSMDDYFAVLGLLPTQEQVDSSAARAFQPLVRWAEQRPELARRYPLSSMLGNARYDAGYQHLRSISPPLAGTYRFEVRLGDQPPRSFFARTRQRPTTGWTLAGGDDDDAADGPDAGDGYTILAVGALSADSLPVDVEPNRNMNREGYLDMLKDPEPGGGEVRTWRGKVELEIVARQFPADSALHRFVRDDFQEYMDRAERGEREDTPARYVMSPGGEVRVEQTVRLRDGRTLRLTGTRISRTTIAEPQ